MVAIVASNTQSTMLLTVVYVVCMACCAAATLIWSPDASIGNVRYPPSIYGSTSTSAVVSSQAGNLSVVWLFSGVGGPNATLVPGLWAFRGGIWTPVTTTGVAPIPRVHANMVRITCKHLNLFNLSVSDYPSCRATLVVRHRFIFSAETLIQ